MQPFGQGAEFPTYNTYTLHAAIGALGGFLGLVVSIFTFADRICAVQPDGLHTDDAPTELEMETENPTSSVKDDRHDPPSFTVAN